MSDRLSDDAIFALAASDDATLEKIVPSDVQSGVKRMAREIMEARFLRERLDAWANELDAAGGGDPANVGRFIAAELRNRMAGK